MARKAPKSSGSVDRQEIREDIKAIGTVSTWLLGFLAIIMGALVSFTFQDLNAVIAEYNYPSLKFSVLALQGIYVVMIFSILRILVLSFSSADAEAKLLKERLDASKTIFNWNMFLAFISLFFTFGFVGYFLYS